jgi:hypothetical protein
MTAKIVSMRAAKTCSMFYLEVASVNSLSAKSVLAGEKLIATYSIST